MKVLPLLITFSITLIQDAISIEDNKCMFMQFGRSLYTPDVDCNKTTICHDNFAITSHLMPPFSEVNVLETLIKRCCSACLRTNAITKKQVNINKYTIESTMVDLKRTSEFAFPFLSTINADTFIGWYFVPVMRVPSFILITVKENNNLAQIIRFGFQLYPLIIICLSLAAITGFLIWVTESYHHENDEFAFSFLNGWFEGFWWSFISMTTVGYGDKVPTKHCGKVIAILWIIIGITLFSILSGELTSIIVQTNSPPPASVRGKVIGVLNYREYDKSYVTQNGGLVYNTKVENSSHDFYTNIKDLMNKLQKREIFGIILDKSTEYYTHQYMKNISNTTNLSSSEREMINFFLFDTVKSEKLYEGDNKAYGVIIKNKKHYDFFGSALIDNRHSLLSEYELSWNEITEERETKQVLLDTKGEPFLHFIKTAFGIIGCIVFIGILFEVNRREPRFCR